MNRSEYDASSDEDSAVAFAYMDFSGVDFDDETKTHTTDAETVKGFMDAEGDGSETIKGLNITETTNESTNQPDVLYTPPISVHENTCTTNVFSSLESVPQLFKTLYKIQADEISSVSLSSSDKSALLLEKHILLSDCYLHLDLYLEEEEEDDNLTLVQTMSQQLSQGYYLPILEGTVAQRFFSSISKTLDHVQTRSLVVDLLRQGIFSYCHTITHCIQLELLAVAAFQLFLQFNYTGPSFDHGVDFETGKRNSKLEQWLLQGSSSGDHVTHDDIQSRLNKVNPHPVFNALLYSVSPVQTEEVAPMNSGSESVNTDTAATEDRDTNMPIRPSAGDPSLLYKVNPSFQNAVLSELAVDGEWPCPVCRAPYFLLLARVILQTLADPNRPYWSLYDSRTVDLQPSCSTNLIKIRSDLVDRYIPPPSSFFVTLTQFLTGASLWSARATVAHTRLLQGDEAPLVFWDEVQDMFEPMIQKYCLNKSSPALEELNLPSELHRTLPTKILLEYGLAQHFHEKNKKGKDVFQQALKMSGLEVSVTGSEGRRTKYQQKSTAQLLVRAKPQTPAIATSLEEGEIKDTEYIQKQLVDHPDPEDNPLLDKVAYVQEADNIHHALSILHQAILLALCLDVKNENPMDGLTAEEMGAYLERVLQQHDDWMVFATGLLERAWLEYERNYTKMRAILQLQALADQHTHRLTITQSTVEAAIENSAPPQERLRNLHYIVYPPRWEMLRDLAERYAQNGIATSAAELFEEIELWDEVVECYRRAGKEGKAEQIVRSRLNESETPRMWTALGDITKDPSHYHRAVDLSRGRFAGAYAALGKYHFDRGESKEASKYYESALHIKPHSPHMWFRLGAIAMQMHDWSLALQAFTEVVQQEPEEGDAWANVAAIHMHNRCPDEAYPALVQSLKINRDNWRVWVSKLYTCIDLKKYDEAIQACMTILDLRAKSDRVPPLEEKCVRAIVKGCILRYCEVEQNLAGYVDEATSAASTESAQRTLNRVNELVSALLSTAKSSDTWIYEVSNSLHKSAGLQSTILEDLMKEYRALQSQVGWETNDAIFGKICRVIDDLASLHIGECTSGEIRKFKMSKDAVDGLKKFRYLLQGVVRKVRTAYFDPSKAPIIQIGKLEDYLEEINRRLQLLTE